MIDRDDLAIYLHDFLACDDFNDYAPNGIQVEGKSRIHRISTAVTASLDVIKKAIAQGSDALFVHHGYFWKGEEPSLRGIKCERIRHLMGHDITLYAYHLPLDCHPEVGNNACLAKRLELDAIQRHTVANTRDLLWAGKLLKPVRAEDLLPRLSQTFNRVPLHLAGSDKPIQHIAFCGGGAQDFIVDAHRLGADAYLSGEVSERTYYQAQELGIHYFACGHHATERYGIQALGEYVSARFQLEHHYIDSDNPV